MIAWFNRLATWILAFFAYKAGEASSFSQAKATETSKELEVSHAVNQAEAAAPDDRAGTADKLRRGDF
jgi:hypothetical protein